MFSFVSFVLEFSYNRILVTSLEYKNEKFVLLPLNGSVIPIYEFGALPLS